MAYLDPDDVTAFAPDIDPNRLASMIADASALAVLAAPCLADETDLTEPQRAAVKAILRGAVLRWDEAGTGALRAETVGSFSQTFDTRQQRRGMFWPSEIAQLQGVCRGVSGGHGGAFAIDTAPTYTLLHLDTCSLRFGGGCSCGALLLEGGGLL